MFSDDKLIAYADGALSAQEAAEIEAALFREPDLAERLERLRRRRKRPRFDAAKALAAARERAGGLGAALAPLAALLAAPPAFLRWALLAVALALGILAGRLSEPAPMLRVEGGAIHADARLAAALDTRISSAPENLRAHLRIGESFRSLEGGYCRTFAVGGRGAVSGLVCREESGWSVRAAAAGLPPQGDFAAERLEAPLVLELRDALIVGDPLDPDQERAARRAGWRR